MIYATETMLSTDYHEIDPSPMATQALKMFAEIEARDTPTKRFRAFCEENPWAPECKLYED